MLDPHINLFPLMAMVILFTFYERLGVSRMRVLFNTFIIMSQSIYSGFTLNCLLVGLTLLTSVLSKKCGPNKIVDY